MELFGLLEFAEDEYVTKMLIGIRAIVTAHAELNPAACFSQPILDETNTASWSLAKSSIGSSDLQI
jgi:hypothetical protein